MILGVSNYSYFKHMRNTGESNFDVFKRAKEMGFEFMGLLDLSAKEDQSVEELAKETAEKLAENGLRMGAYTVSADFYKTTAEQELERLKKCVDIAEILGAKKMRHDVVWAGKDHRASIKELAPFIRELTKYAEQKGISTMTENHGFYLQASDRMEMLVNEVNCDNYGLLIDMGNFLCADEAPEHAVAALAKYAKHVHVKDFIYKNGGIPVPSGGFIETTGANYIRGTIAGHGIVPIAKCLKILKKAGYDGDIAYEFEGPEENLDAIAAGYENIRTAMSI